MADYAILAKAQSINVIAQFISDLHNLKAILGQANVQIMAPGSAWKMYKAEGTVKSGTVAEKAEITDSDLKMKAAAVTEITYQKYRNLTSIEAIGKMGYEVAVSGTNAALLKDVQKGIRKSIFTALNTGTGTAKGTGFQDKCAKAAAALSKVFEDEAASPILFANPDDAYEYLGSHNVTLESGFGLSYLKNFLGLGNVIIDSNVPAGTVLATAAENLVLTAASLIGIPGMDLMTDESGILAVHNDARYDRAALETVVYSGLAVQPIFIDRIFKVTSAA